MDRIQTNLLGWIEQNPNYIVIAVIAFAVFGIFLGIGENRKIIIFRTYDDLFLTFLVPAFLFIGYVGLNSNSETKENGLFALLGVLALISSVIIFIYVTFLTLKSNSYSPWKFLAAMTAKFPLAFIWVMQLISLLNPPGETGVQRAKNRGTALVVLTFLTPVVGSLIAEKTGVFAPRQILKGKRIGSMRKHL